MNRIEDLKRQLAEAEAEEALRGKKFERYVVEPGDSLWKIAVKYYGDGSRWPEIYEVNKGVIGGNPDLIHPQQKFKIPLD